MITHFPFCQELAWVYLNWNWDSYFDVVRNPFSSNIVLPILPPDSGVSICNGIVKVSKKKKKIVMVMMRGHEEYKLVLNLSKIKVVKRISFFY